MRIRKITAPNPGPFTLTGTQTYLLGETTLLDPGPVIPSHIAALQEAMPALRTILITHRHADHAPAAVALRESTGAVILAPNDVLDDSVIERRIHGGEVVHVEGERLTVIATPGHTREHVCFLTDDGDLFTGDTILGSGTTAIFPPDGNMGDYLRSLAVLRSLNPRRIYPAHGPIREEATTLIDEYIAHRLSRERQILEAFHAGATTTASLRTTIYPDLDPRLHAAAEIQIEAHLLKLEEDGMIARDRPTGIE